MNIHNVIMDNDIMIMTQYAMEYGVWSMEGVPEIYLRPALDSRNEVLMIVVCTSNRKYVRQTKRTIIVQSYTM